MAIPNHLPPMPNDNTIPNNTCYAELIGGTSIALISGIVLGIIFGPLAAVAGVCCGGIIGAYAALKISSCFSKNEPIILSQPPMTEEQLERRARLLEELNRYEAEAVRLSEESRRLSDEYRRLLANRR